MKIWYECKEDEDISWCYEPPEYMLRRAKIDILEEQDKEDLIEIIISEDNIEECFYEQLKDYFEEYAWEEYKQELANSEPPYNQNDFI